VSNATDPATIPGASASKVTLLILLVLAALIIGIALAFLIDYLDDRIRTKDEVAYLLALPIYAEVPSAPTPGRTVAKQ
jgi:capsular polysaccharide biosynthesis protein